MHPSPNHPMPSSSATIIDAEKLSMSSCMRTSRTTATTVILGEAVVVVLGTWIQLLLWLAVAIFILGGWMGYGTMNATITTAHAFVETVAVPDR
jgi:hypothetical protein